MLVCLAVLSTHPLLGQSSAFVDDNGVMRWGDSNKEVYGFGVNYTVPFAHAYRSALKLGVDPKQAIDDDIYHFSRLGFDAYRVHVWDTEISDTLGNLFNNEHLELLDYALGKMKEQGMKFVITPIAFWGNGWPEPSEKTPGFSAKYGKGDCLTNEDAIRAQEKYLYQFLNHVNPHTGLAYKDDPSIVAFEVSNEPHHGQPADSVTRYVNKMVSSMRSTGCEKPIFYNVSHSIHLIDAYYDAPINGGTFQWYPTNLVKGEELKGNFLPNVDRYDIPFADNPEFKKNAKIVYEFDAADIGRSYIYPAMARSFRTAGIQWATHFAYDPTYLAYANTEYNTHYMNLAYTPQKALSLKIASEVFHEVPVYKDYGSYPKNAQFDDFRVSYEEDLAELVINEKYFYTNNTSTIPPAPKKLKEIAGFGNSPLINYDGQGAYFIDKIEKGIWRLEVMPDAIWVKNPFGSNSLDRTVAVINWNTWSMKIDLPDLGESFSIHPIDEGNAWKSEVNKGEFMIRPGVYLLAMNEVKNKVEKDQSWKNIQLNDFFAPKTTVKERYVIHEPIDMLSEGAGYTIEATIVDVEEPESVHLIVYAGWRPERYEMTRKSGYQYEVEIPGSKVEKGVLRYYIVVTGKGVTSTHPEGITGSPGDWDFDGSNVYEVNVVSSDAPIYLFNALTDHDAVSSTRARNSLVPLSEPGKAELKIEVNTLNSRNVGGSDEKEVLDFAMRYSFKEKIRGREERLKTAKELVLSGYALTENTSSVQIALISSNGQTYGGMIDLDMEKGDYRIPISDLKKVSQVLLPRPYPTFLPYYFDNQSNTVFDISKIETIQLSIGPGLSNEQLAGKHGVAIESLRLD